MKKLLLFLFIFLLRLSVYAQIFSQQLAYFSGYGRIFYPAGFYQGYLIYGVAYGQGTLYFSDGTIIQGTFNKGLLDGPAVVIKPYGFISGCWQMGIFMGQCPTAQYNYDQNQVLNVINYTAQNINSPSNIPSNSPINNSTPSNSVDPTNYTVRTISPDSPLGRQIVGGIRIHP